MRVCFLWTVTGRCYTRALSSIRFSRGYRVSVHVNTKTLTRFIVATFMLTTCHVPALRVSYYCEVRPNINNGSHFGKMPLRLTLYEVSLLPLPETCNCKLGFARVHSRITDIKFKAFHNSTLVNLSINSGREKSYLKSYFVLAAASSIQWGSCGLNGEAVVNVSSGGHSCSGTLTDWNERSCHPRSKLTLTATGCPHFQTVGKYHLRDLSNFNGRQNEMLLVSCL